MHVVISLRIGLDDMHVQGRRNMTVIGGGISARYLEHCLYRHTYGCHASGRKYCRRWVETVRGKTRGTHLANDDDLECIALTFLVCTAASYPTHLLSTKHVLKYLSRYRYTTSDSLAHKDVDRGLKMPLQSESIVSTRPWTRQLMAHVSA